MIGLVERLRADELPGDRQHQREARIVLSSILLEAAERIERLERELLFARSNATQIKDICNNTITTVDHAV